MFQGDRGEQPFVSSMNPSQLIWCPSGFKALHQFLKQMCCLVMICLGNTIFQEKHKRSGDNRPVYSSSLCWASCLTLCGPVRCSPPGSSIHGILQARILEWVARPSSRGSSQPRSPALQTDSLPAELPGKPTAHLCHLLTEWFWTGSFTFQTVLSLPQKGNNTPYFSWLVEG